MGKNLILMLVLMALVSGYTQTEELPLEEKIFQWNGYDVVIEGPAPVELEGRLETPIEHRLQGAPCGYIRGAQMANLMLGKSFFRHTSILAFGNQDVLKAAGSVPTGEHIKIIGSEGTILVKRGGEVIEVINDKIADKDVRVIHLKSVEAVGE